MPKFTLNANEFFVGTKEPARLDRLLKRTLNAKLLRDINGNFVVQDVFFVVHCFGFKPTVYWTLFQQSYAFVLLPENPK